MPRFFFHICDKDGRSEDEEGSEFHDLGQAQEEAKLSARDLAKQYIDNRRSTEGHRIEVSDAQGRLLATISVAEVIENPRAPRFSTDGDG